MNKKTWLTYAAIPVLIVLGVVIFKGQEAAAPAISGGGQTSNQDQSSQGGQQAYQIIYSDTGYAPASLTVPLGAKVVFKNESAMAMWPASAPYPTHTAYPEFDAKAGLAAGQAYEFVFDKIGAWQYHDHLSPQFFGKISVE